MNRAYGKGRWQTVMTVTVPAYVRVVRSVQMDGLKSLRGPLAILMAAERGIFAFVGALFFIAAFALAIRSTVELWALMIGPRDTIIVAGTAFLNLMLLVLMMVELAYTVIVSLKGTILAAEPFLIVGLIAVIRRILVITIGDVSTSGAPARAAPDAHAIYQQPVELGTLTIVVLVLVWSIVLLRRRAQPAEPLFERERDPAEIRI